VLVFLQPPLEMSIGFVLLLACVLYVSHPPMTNALPKGNRLEPA